MSLDDVEEVVRRQIAKSARVDPAEVGPKTELARELGMSSIELLDVLAALEMRYGIQVPDRELAGLTNLNSIVAKVRSLVAKEGRG